jgi:hypothetical protein
MSSNSGLSMMTGWLTCQNKGEHKKKKTATEINYDKHEISVDTSSQLLA